MIERKAVNNGLTIWLLKCFDGIFVRGSTEKILLNFYAENPSFSQTQNCYRQAQKTTKAKI
ncbi:hypothetical protein CQA01_43600 [Cyclobacterium qasimii]|uniref:Uncharacterized protein n=1 Tax=Cyclobacterium qasimii TaxID=1350429 RepID=A0A512CI13_9BACT|nr:hypothetical protein CQA01_43600 [Cyclobacterium qasimii]